MQNECYEQKNVDFFKHTQLFTKEYQDAKIKSLHDGGTALKKNFN